MIKKIIRPFGLTFLLLFFFQLIPAPAHARRQSMGDGYLHLYNVHLKERVVVQYRKPNGAYIRPSLEKINRALRCRMTGHEHQTPVDLLELVDEIQDHFAADEVFVLSGYRSSQLNEQLRRSGRKVAKNSLHMAGFAMDIRIPGVSPAAIRDYARFLRKGGVGYYPRNHFVHVDIGRVRYW